MINYEILRIFSFGKDMKELHVSYMVDKSTKLCDHLEKQFISYKVKHLPVLQVEMIPLALFPTDIKLEVCTCLWQHYLCCQRPFTGQ